MTVDSRDAHSATALVEQYLLLLEERDAKIASLTAQLARCREETVEECRQVNIKEADACIVFAAMSQAPLELVQMHEQAACALKKAAETIRALAPTTEDGR